MPDLPTAVPWKYTTSNAISQLYRQRQPKIGLAPLERIFGECGVTTLVSLIVKKETGPRVSISGWNGHEKSLNIFANHSQRLC